MAPKEVSKHAEQLLFSCLGSKNVTITKKMGMIFFGHHHHKPYLMTLKVTRAGFQLKN